MAAYQTSVRLAPPVSDTDLDTAELDAPLETAELFRRAARADPSSSMATMPADS
jgi:hypothetical protein